MMRVLSPFVPFLLLGVFAVQSVAALEDVLLRSDALWETMEGIHRHGVDTRVSQVTERGTFDTTVNLGYGGIFNWVDVWGPTYVCPTMEHFGTIGDGGKWVCGVETMLQRCEWPTHASAVLTLQVLALSQSHAHALRPVGRNQQLTWIA